MGILADRIRVKATTFTGDMAPLEDVVIDTPQMEEMQQEYASGEEMVAEEKKKQPLSAFLEKIGLGIEYVGPKRGNVSFAIARYPDGHKALRVPKGTDIDDPKVARIIWHEIGHHFDESRTLGGRSQMSSRIQYGTYSSPNWKALMANKDYILGRRVGPEIKIQFKINDKKYNGLEEVLADPNVLDSHKEWAKEQARKQQFKIKMYLEQNIELFAEGFALFMEDPAKMKSEAPDLYDVFSKAASEHPELAEAGYKTAAMKKTAAKRYTLLGITEVLAKKGGVSKFLDQDSIRDYYRKSIIRRFGDDTMPPEGTPEWDKWYELMGIKDWYQIGVSQGDCTPERAAEAIDQARQRIYGPEAAQQFIDDLKGRLGQTAKLLPDDAKHVNGKELKHGLTRDGKRYGVSIAKDKDGYFCYTHRARSKSYPTIADIPKSALKFIDSTGMKADAAKRYTLLGITDERTDCDVCGKSNLKSTMVLRDNESDDIKYCGSECGRQLLGDGIKEYVRQGRDLNREVREFIGESWRNHPMVSRLRAIDQAAVAKVNDHKNSAMPFRERMDAQKAERYADPFWAENNFKDHPEKKLEALADVRKAVMDRYHYEFDIDDKNFGFWNTNHAYASSTMPVRYSTGEQAVTAANLTMEEIKKLYDTPEKQEQVKQKIENDRKRGFTFDEIEKIAKSVGGMPDRDEVTGRYGFYGRILFNKYTKADAAIKQLRGEGYDVSERNASPNNAYFKYVIIVKKPAVTAMTATAASDDEYLTAVERNDMAAAQSMVDAAAKSAGYTIGPVYHGTNSKFNVFKPQFGKAIWFSEDREKIARGDSGASGTQRIVPVFLKATNPAGWKEYDKLLEMQIISNGFDSVHLDDDWIVYSPSQIKSAEPVVYNNFGKVVPLSKRFNPASNDIRAMRVDANSDTPYLPDINEVLACMDEARSMSGSFDDLYKGYDKDPDDTDEYEYDSKEKAYEFAQMVLDILGGLPDPVPAYRAISAASVEAINKEYMGESWSFDKDAAIEFGSHNGSNYLLQALVPRDAIDWTETVNRFCENSKDPFSGEAEMEIVVSDESRISNLEVYQIKGMKKVARRVMAATTKKYQIAYGDGHIEFKNMSPSFVDKVKARDEVVCVEEVMPEQKVESAKGAYDLWGSIEKAVERGLLAYVGFMAADYLHQKKASFGLENYQSVIDAYNDIEDGDGLTDHSKSAIMSRLNDAGWDASEEGIEFLWNEIRRHRLAES